MRDLFLVREKATGKYYRRLQQGLNIVARADIDLHDLTSLTQLFFFESPEAALRWLNTEGAPLPRDTEIIPCSLTVKDPVQVIAVSPIVEGLVKAE